MCFVVHVLGAERGARCASVFVRRPSLMEMTALYLFIATVDTGSTPEETVTIESQEETTGCSRGWDNDRERGGMHDGRQVRD